MERKKIAKVVAGKAANVLDAVLRAEANSTSCLVVYQPKAPKDLARFRKEK